MFRPNCRAIFRLISEYVQCTIDSVFKPYQISGFEGISYCTLHLLKDQAEEDPTIRPKHVTGIITQYNLIKYKFVYDCFIYIYMHIQHNGKVSLENYIVSLFSWN